MNLSIIIPVYNVEKYLAKCLDSILVGNCFTGQVVCVNDGSTDGSAAILEDYGKKYPNVEIITQPNAGLSAARNAGIMAAKGEYICFLDSDDYWESNVLDGLLAQIERDKLDVLRFKYQNVRIVKKSFENNRDKKSEEGIVNSKYEVFNPNKSNPYRNDDYSEAVTDGVSFLNSRFGTACYAVMFIVKRELLDGCLFTEGMYFEDVDWTPRMLSRANRAASTDTIVYNYLVREGSITKAVNREKQKKVLDDKMRLIQTLKQQAIDLKKSGRYNRWYHNMIAAIVISVITKVSGEFYDERDAYLEQLQELNVLPIKAISLKAQLVNFSPRWAVELLRFRKRR